MTYTSKLTLDQFREKKEKRENQNVISNKLGNNNHNNFKFTIYNPGRRRIGSYNLIN